MFNRNQELGGKGANAREWTAEIEAATNAEVAAREQAEAGDGQETVRERGREARGGQEAARGEAELGAEVARSEGQDLGRKIIASGNLRGGSGAQRSEGGRGAERALARGERELARDERELTEAGQFVGEETSRQVGERLADDREDLMTEMGQGLALENRVMAKTQEGVAKVVAPKVEQMVGQASYRPADLMRLYRQGVNETLRVFNRRIGDRN